MARSLAGIFVDAVGWDAKGTVSVVYQFAPRAIGASPMIDAWDAWGLHGTPATDETERGPRRLRGW